MGDYTITYPCPPGVDPSSEIERLEKILDEGSNNAYSEDVPILYADYREFAVNTLFQRAFSKIFLPTGVKWIDYLFEREGFRRSFQDNMKRMLSQGEYFAVLDVRDGKIRIDRLPADWVRRAGVYEKTGELMLLIYVEPIVLPSFFETKIGWRKVTITPSLVIEAISADEDHPDDDEMYVEKRRIPNVYGFVPVIPFKLGTKERGEPIWSRAVSQIDQINDIINDIRIVNAYNAAPVKYVKTDGAFAGLGSHGYVELGVGDDIGIIQAQTSESLFTELDYAVGVYSDVLGIPITSILQVGKHASGESIEKRLDTLTRKAKELREYVGNQIQLMIRMLSAFVAQGLVDGIDFEDPFLKPLLTSCVVLSEASEEEKANADKVFMETLGSPVDLAVYEVPEIKWPPIEDLDPQGLTAMIDALGKAVEYGFLTTEAAIAILYMNFDQFVVAADLASLQGITAKPGIDRNKEAASKGSSKDNSSGASSVSDERAT